MYSHNYVIHLLTLTKNSRAFNLLFRSLLQDQRPVGNYKLTYFLISGWSLNSLTGFIIFQHILQKTLTRLREKNAAFADLFHQKWQVWAVLPFSVEMQVVLSSVVFWLDFHHTDPVTSCYGHIVKTQAPACNVPPAKWLSVISACSEKRVWPEKVAAAR